MWNQALCLHEMAVRMYGAVPKASANSMRVAARGFEYGGHNQVVPRANGATSIPQEKPVGTIHSLLNLQGVQRQCIIRLCTLRLKMVISEYALSRYEQVFLAGPNIREDRRATLEMLLEVARHTQHSNNVMAVLFHRQVHERARDFIQEGHRFYEEQCYAAQCRVVHGFGNQSQDAMELLLSYKGGSVTQMFKELKYFIHVLNFKNKVLGVLSGWFTQATETFRDWVFRFRVWRDPINEFGPGFGG
jgi:hypothetical protein